MATITVPDNLRDIAYQAFENTAWLNNAPDGVVYLGKVAYCYKGEMPAGTSITLRDGTLATAEGAFESQDNLTGVTLPNTLSVIGGYAFCWSRGLKSINFPNSIIEIEDGAFDNCTGLENIFSEIIRPANVRLRYGVFYDVPTATCVLHIPVGALGRYGAAEQWKDFVNMVEDQGGDLLGDLDGNGLLEVNDVVVLAEYAMSGGASAEATALGDMDGNGLIEVNDVVILAGLVMGS
ncbi:MAG: leucine-rich repeat domain-containing protein [Muribaculaceae bacterium]|nr:leucine-rich repeat domain-containing protein [Muribaculaceae bacterium]